MAADIVNQGTAMTVRQKFISSIVIFNITLLVLGISVLFGYHYVTRKASLANDFNKEAMYLVETVEAPEVRKILTEHIDPEWKTIKQAIESFLDHPINLDNDEAMVQEVGQTTAALCARFPVPGLE